MERQLKDFWIWFESFARRLPDGEPSEPMLDELLAQIHSIDKRVYFELSTNTDSKELILTAQGYVGVFPIVESIIRAASPIDGWSFIALKPPMGFDFTHRNNGIVLDASKLWFRPLVSKTDSAVLAIEFGVPDAKSVLARQVVDTAYTILETGIGERSCALDLQRVYVGDLPEEPASEGWIELPRLADYIASHKARMSEQSTRV